MLARRRHVKGMPKVDACIAVRQTAPNRQIGAPTATFPWCNPSPEHATSPLPHDRVKQIIARIYELAPKEGLIHRFHGVPEPSAPLLTHDLHQSSTRGVEAAELNHVPCFQTLADNSCMRLVGARLRTERNRRQPLAQHLSKLAANLLDATNPYRNQQLTQLAKEAAEEGQGIPARPDHVPANPHNSCHTNSCVHFLLWLGQVCEDSQAVYGAVESQRHVSIPGLLPWRQVLNAWPELRRQHDVPEFWSHLIQHAEPSALTGS